MEQQQVDVEPQARTVPTWFRLASVAALLWMVLGAAMAVIGATTDPSTLPLDQRALAEASPEWMTMLMGAAVAAGLVGTVLLLMARAGAVMWLGLSLLLTIAHFAPLVLDPDLRNLTNDAMLTGPILVMLVGYGIFHLGRLGRRRGWLA